MNRSDWTGSMFCCASETRQPTIKKYKCLSPVIKQNIFHSVLIDLPFHSLTEQCVCVDNAVPVWKLWSLSFDGFVHQLHHDASSPFSSFHMKMILFSDSALNVCSYTTAKGSIWLMEGKKHSCD